MTFFIGQGQVQVASRRLSQAMPWLLEHHLESHSDLSLPVRQARPGLGGPSLGPVQVATGSQARAPPRLVTDLEVI